VDELRRSLAARRDDVPLPARRAVPRAVR
jgi:hypothetical protein